MLDSMYFAFCEQPVDRIVAWDRFIDFLATDNNATLFTRLNHKFEWLFEDSRLEEGLETVYKPDLLKTEYYDHLGEMYVRYVLSPGDTVAHGIPLPSVELAKSIARSVVGNDSTPRYILDPAVGTGRVLMAIHEIAKDCTLYGVGKDLRSLRIAFTNFAIHGINAQLLHADPMIHEIDLGSREGLYNWQYANQWYSCRDRLKPKNTNSTLKPKSNGSK